MGRSKIGNLCNIEAYHTADRGIDGYRVLAGHEAAEISRNGGVGAEAFCRTDQIGYIEIRFEDGPEVHHGLGQVRLVHLVMDLILNYPFEVLKRASENHAAMGFEYGHVDNVLCLQEKPG